MFLDNFINRKQAVRFDNIFSAQNRVTKVQEMPIFANKSVQSAEKIAEPKNVITNQPFVSNLFGNSNPNEFQKTLQPTQRSIMPRNAALNLVEYLAQSKPKEVTDFLQKNGYETDNLPKRLSQIMAEKGEDAVHGIAELHPDFEMIKESVISKKSNEIKEIIQKNIEKFDLIKLENENLKQSLERCKNESQITRQDSSNRVSFKTFDGSYDVARKNEAIDIMPYILIMVFGVLIYKIIK